MDGAVPAEEAGERQLKGFSRPMPVYRIDPSGSGAGETAESAEALPAAEAS